MRKAGNWIGNYRGFDEAIQGSILKGNRFLLLTVCVFAMTAASRCHAAADLDVAIERNVPVQMRDGVVLRADVYRPKPEGKFPVLIMRTPYDKASRSALGLTGATRGYVVINQDCRGRFASEGEWEPFRYESKDGYDTVEWAAALPYSNGKIGLIVGSYCGATQLLAAIAQPPHLVGLLPDMTAANYHDGWVYQGGAFELYFNQTWISLALAPDTLNRRIQKNPKTTQSIWRLPLTDYPCLMLGL